MLFVLIIFAIFILGLMYTHYFRPYYIINKAIGLPGPPPNVFLGNYSEISKLGYLDSVRKWMSQYGPSFTYYLGIKPIVVTEDLKAIRSILVKNFDSFINRTEFPRLLKKRNEPALPMLRNEKWRRVRRMLTPTFSGKRLKMMSPLIQECCVKLRNKMAAISDTDTTIDVYKWFGAFTLQVILTTAFSRDISSDNVEENPLTKAAASVFRSGSSGVGNKLALERALMTLSHFPWSTPLLRYFARRTSMAKTWDFLEETALKLIEDRQNVMATTGFRAQDLLQSILEAHDEGTGAKSGSYLSNNEVVATIVIFMLAGYDTTNNALSYTAYLLALNPAIQDRLIREIKDYYDANPDSSLYDAADNIDYVTMVLYESLRMYPPAHITTRECKQTCAVTDDLILEKGTDVTIPIFLLHRNPEHWSDPDKFDPERFNPSNEQSYPTYAYLPFGEGPRHCIGKRLAMLEVKMALVAILKDLQFKRTTDTEVPLDVTAGAIMSPTNGIRLTIVSNSL